MLCVTKLPGLAWLGCMTLLVAHPRTLAHLAPLPTDHCLSHNLQVITALRGRLSESVEEAFGTLDPKTVCMRMCEVGGPACGAVRKQTRVLRPLGPVMAARLRQAAAARADPPVAGASSGNSSCAALAPPPPAPLCRRCARRCRAPRTWRACRWVRAAGRDAAARGLRTGALSTPIRGRRSRGAVRRPHPSCPPWPAPFCDGPQPLALGLCLPRSCPSPCRRRGSSCP